MIFLKYSFIEALREFKILLKNHFWALLGILVFSIYILRNIYIGLIAHGVSLLPYRVPIGILFLLVAFLLFLFRKKSVFFIIPAAIIWFSNTRGIKSVLATAVFMKSASTVFFVAILSLFIHNFELTRTFWLDFLSISFYFMSINFLLWFKYNRKKIISLLILLSINSALFLLSFAFGYYLSIIGSLFVFVFLIYYSFWGLKIDWMRLYDDVFYSYRVDNAARRQNLAEMQQIIAEQSSRQKHVLRLFQFPLDHNNALFFKALIETTRIDKQLILIFMGFMMFSVIINRTSILSSVPFLGEPVIAKIIGVFSTSTYLTILKELYSKQILSILEKHKSGLFIPYSFPAIVFNYGSIGIIVSMICVAVLGLLLNTSIVPIIYAQLLLVISNLAYFYSLSKGKVNFFFNLLTNAMIFIVASFIFGLL